MELKNATLIDRIVTLCLSEENNADWNICDPLYGWNVIIGKPQPKDDGKNKNFL